MLRKPECPLTPRLKITNCDLEAGQNIKCLPYVFTEHGAIMATTVTSI